MALSAAEMQEAVIRNLPEKTGKSLEEWVRIARSIPVSKPSELVKKLKSDHGLGHVQAQTIVWRLNGETPYVETAGYEEGIFRSEGNLERYQVLKTTLLALGADVKAKPCKTYIPFYRNRQFAILTERKGALILGLALPEGDYPDLLPAEKIGGSDRITRFWVVRDGALPAAVSTCLMEAYHQN